MGPTPYPDAARGGPAPPHGVDGSWLSSFSPSFGLHVRVGKIGSWVFVSSNSKNISVVTFLKRKRAENSELALWHLVNRLVQ